MFLLWFLFDLGTNEGIRSSSFDEDQKEVGGGRPMLYWNLMIQCLLKSDN